MTKPATKIHASRIKAIRKELGLSQKQLAEKMGINQAAIALVENSKNGLSNQLRKGLIDALGVSQAFIDKGTLPVMKPVNETKETSGFATKERELLLQQIQHLQEALEDKKKIIALYERIK